MMGQHKSDPQLFNYAVNLEKRVRAAHPLRRVRATIDFGFVREEVAHCYGKNGNESVAPELITALKRAYRATESKLEESSTPETYQAVNDRMMSKSDPDAALVRKGGGDSRPRYQNHRVIDDQKGVVTATETTPGSIAENKKLMTLIDQHQSNTRSQAQTVVADHKYGTAENFVACQERGI